MYKASSQRKNTKQQHHDKMRCQEHISKSLLALIKLDLLVYTLNLSVAFLQYIWFHLMFLYPEYAWKTRSVRFC
jgi:hypothetical protein